MIHFGRVAETLPLLLVRMNVIRGMRLGLCRARYRGLGGMVDEELEHLMCFSVCQLVRQLRSRQLTLFEGANVE
jgi:hypothetical protein